jgi:hypothetical protein
MSALRCEVLGNQKNADSFCPMVAAMSVGRVCLIRTLTHVSTGGLAGVLQMVRE